MTQFESAEPPPRIIQDTPQVIKQRKLQDKKDRAAAELREKMATCACRCASYLRQFVLVPMLFTVVECRFASSGAAAAHD
jgi:hypothetical protein